MAATSFDFDVFAIAVASELLGVQVVQETLASNAADEVHWYWRSHVCSETQCPWMDSSWELKRGSIVWKLGYLWKNKTGALYVQSDELRESDFRQFFKSKLSIDLESSPAVVLAETFARALQHSHHAECVADRTSIHLEFSDLEITAAFPLATDLIGTRTEVNPVILSRLQYTSPPVTTQSSATMTKEQVVAMFHSWKSQYVSLKRDHDVSALPIIDEKGVSSLEKKPSNSKKPVNAKRRQVHGYSKVSSRSHKKPGLKFKETS